MANRVGPYNWRGDTDLILKAISNKTRRKILKLLTQNVSKVSMLAKELKVTPATMSEHVTILTKAKLVSKLRTGKGITLNATPGRLLNVKLYIDQYKEYWVQAEQSITKRTQIPLDF